MLHHFDGKPWAVRRSLNTSDLRQANDKARMLQAEWSQRFADMRSQNNPVKVSLNAALVSTIAAEVRRRVFVVDDNLRDFPEVPRLLVRMKRQREAHILKLHLAPLSNPRSMRTAGSGQERKFASDRSGQTDFQGGGFVAPEARCWLKWPITQGARHARHRHRGKEPIW